MSGLLAMQVSLWRCSGAFGCHDVVHLVFLSILNRPFGNFRNSLELQNGIFKLALTPNNIFSHVDGV